VLDNLSSLTAALRENDSDSWSPIQDWLLRLRRRFLRFQAVSKLLAFPAFEEPSCR
jgi:hypothetical protein